MTKGVKRMATSDYSQDFRVMSVNEYSDTHVSVNLIQTSVNNPVPPGVPAGPNGSLNLVVEKDDARSIFPGDTYTVSLSKK